MLIREAEEQDLPRIMELLRGMDEEEGMDSKEAKAVWAKTTSYPYYKVFVVEEKQQLLATCSLIILDNLGHRGAKLAVAESMIVSEDYRGQGIGVKLMQFVIAKAKEEDCYKLMLSSNKKRVEAHKFYEQLGFRQHGISFMLEVGKND